jgi:hypothetical protein
MSVVVFLGPSLAAAEARAILDADYLPPARRGDIAAAVGTRRAETIVLIDGYFEQVPAVWHKEILWALSRGVRVCGAASMGALRAAELAQFGMLGAGRVFEAYRTGRFAPFDDAFEDDDEVAVVHGPAAAGYAATEALVDIRATLAAAEAAGVIDAAERDGLAAAAKAMFYKRRSWAALLEGWVRGERCVRARTLREGGPEPEYDRCVRARTLRPWLAENRVRQKALDAALLLGLVRDGLAPAEPPAFRFERTLIWQAAMPEGAR